MKNTRLLSERIFRAALQAVDPAHLVQQQAPRLIKTLHDGHCRRLVLVACGKAGAVMASALESALPALVSDGIVITKYGHSVDHPCRHCRIFEAGHPLPDASGVKATADALQMIDAAAAETLVVVLLSGGGSALLVAPAPGLSLGQKQRTTDLLLRAGADIRELNTVRKHLSAVKGGQLARRAWPATVQTLILSDVIGDPLDIIASGPTAADPSTYAEALAVLARFDLLDQTPREVTNHLRLGVAGNVAETPKPGEPMLALVENRIIGNNLLALEAAATEARSLGYTVEILTDTLSGEASQAAHWLAAQARAAVGHGTRLCFLAGGETTVRVQGNGKGGRNQELALAFALEIAGSTVVSLLSAGTDGTDGPTDAAGAFADGDTVSLARQKGLVAERFLANNDSYTFFDRAGGLLRTGPTGTNVMDLQILLIEGSPCAV